MDDRERRARFEAVAAETYEPLQRYLLRRGRADDADEVLNDTLLVIWRRLDEIPTDATLPWCYGVARRCLANHHRASTRRLRLVGRIGSTDSRRLEQTWTSAADVELHEALQGLGEVDREVVRLWAWERLDIRDIAEILGVSPNAISVRLNRIRRLLGRQLSRQNRGSAGHVGNDGHSEMEP